MNLQTEEQLALAWARKRLVLSLPRWGWVVAAIALLAGGHFL